MKNSYNPKNSTKKQRHKKKWIPKGIYCYDFKMGNCPFWHEIRFPIRKKEECQFGKVCETNCNECNEPVAHCSFLNYTEYGQFPLGDMCKICGIHLKE